MRTTLKIPQLIWDEMIAELRRRGEGRRESAAFLLGLPASFTITRFISLDDLDPHAFDTGIIRFASLGFVRLWNLCASEHLTVLADVHTHPGKWTGQSATDERHPMIHQKGHLAMIVPSYAQGRQQTLRGVGVYEYLGEGKWKTYVRKSRAVKIVK
jgi:hypothetical protein